VPESSVRLLWAVESTIRTFAPAGGSGLTKKMGLDSTVGSRPKKKAVHLMSNEFPASESPTPRPEVPSRPDLAKPAPRNPTGRTRLSGTWVSVIIGVVVLVLLLAFIIQNTKSVKVSFFTVSRNMPLGVALLLAAVGGVLLAGVVASLRIWQLRHRLHNSK